MACMDVYLACCLSRLPFVLRSLLRVAVGVSQRGVLFCGLRS